MPAPVSAITRGLPMRRASSAWPITLLTLCAPVWFRSSRLRIDLRAAELSRPALGVIDRARAADVMLELVCELREELGIARDSARTPPSARRARGSAFRRRTRRRTGRNGRARPAGHTSALRTPAMNAAIFRASLMPLADSTPLETSTAHGRTRRIASPTFSASSPPESTMGSGSARGIRPQSKASPVPPCRSSRYASSSQPAAS